MSWVTDLMARVRRKLARRKHRRAAIKEALRRWPHFSQGVPRAVYVAAQMAEWEISEAMRRYRKMKQKAA